MAYNIAFFKWANDKPTRKSNQRKLFFLLQEKKINISRQTNSFHFVNSGGRLSFQVIIFASFSRDRLVEKVKLNHNKLEKKKLISKKNLKSAILIEKINLIFIENVK